MQKLNTHYYDGCLNTRYNELVAYIAKNNINVLSLNICYEEIKRLIEEVNGIKEGKKKICRFVLEKLVGEDGNNYDRVNNIEVKKLLEMVWSLVKNYDESGKLLFLEQLGEISGGMCAQGRSARLLQMAEFNV